VLHKRRVAPPRRRSNLAGRLVLAAAATVAACAAPVHRPSAATRAAVQRAEDAELHRRHARARALYEDAVAGAPDGPSQVFARREYAGTLESWGEVAAAIAQLEAVVRIAPGDAPSWHDLGILRHARGDDPGALAALRRAEALAPHDARPRVALAALLWRTGDLAGAEAEYRVLLGMDLPARVHRKVAWALDRLRQLRAPPPTGAAPPPTGAAPPPTGAARP
jgi:Flp pilus assembly protein TadD